MAGNYKEYQDKWKNHPIRMSDVLWNKVKKNAKAKNMFISEYLRKIIEEVV